MAEKENKQASEPKVNTEQVAASAHPDAAFYVLQPTSQPIPEHMGDVPEGRFQEEVLKGSEEEDSSTYSNDAHPAENQPRYGVRAEDSDSSSSDKGKK
jgi:hypothetical protein